MRMNPGILGGSTFKQSLRHYGAYWTLCQDTQSCGDEFRVVDVSWSIGVQFLPQRRTASTMAVRPAGLSESAKWHPSLLVNCDEVPKQLIACWHMTTRHNLTHQYQPHLWVAQIDSLTETFTILHVFNPLKYVCIMYIIIYICLDIHYLPAKPSSKPSVTSLAQWHDFNEIPGNLHGALCDALLDLLDA